MRSAPSFGVLLATASALAVAATTSIELVPQGRVVGTRVALGDIAVIHSADLERVRELASLPVAVSPMMGGSLVLTRVRLASHVAARTDAVDVEWSGAVSTRVHRVADGAEEGSAKLASEAAQTGWLVRRGDYAVLAAGEGGVAVQARVEVLQDGRAGQRVLVRGMAWPQPIAARVVGAGSLEPAR